MDRIKFLFPAQNPIFLAIITLTQNVQSFTAKKCQVETYKIFISNWPLQQKFLPGGYLNTFSSFVYSWFRYIWQLDKF